MFRVIAVSLGVLPFLAACGGSEAFEPKNVSHLRHSDAFDPQRDRSLQACSALDKVWNPSTKLCVKGREAMETCQSSSLCFSGSCQSGRCACPTARSCFGCTRSGAACLRVEQPNPTRPLEVCALEAIQRGTTNTKIGLFSGGLRHTSNYSNVPFLSRGIVSASSQNCVVGQTYRAPKDLPPSFVQANVMTTDPATIGSVRVQVRGQNPVSAIDGIVFLNGNWVKNLRWLDANKGGPPGYHVYTAAIWPRVKAPNLATAKAWIGSSRYPGWTVVVEVRGETPTNVWTTSIPIGVGLEFVGVGGGRPTLRIVGSVDLRGRLSFKNLYVSFDGGSISVNAPLIFQQSRIVNTGRCPQRFTEIGGLCLFLSEQVDTGDDASNTCTLYDRAFLPKLADLTNPIAVAAQLIPSGQSAWLQGAGRKCPTLQSDGTALASASNCTASFLPTLCAARVKDPLPGQNWTSYFSNYLAPDLYSMFQRLDKGNLVQGTFRRHLTSAKADSQILKPHLRRFSSVSRCVTVGGTLSVYQIDLLDSQKNATRLSVTDAQPASVTVSVTLASGLRSSVLVALDTASGPKALDSLGKASYTYRGELSSKLPSRIQVHATAPVCVKRLELYFTNGTGTSQLAFSLPVSALAECEGMNACTRDDESKCTQSLMYYDKVNKCAVLQPNTVIVPRDFAIKLFTTACDRLTTWSHSSLGQPMLLQVDYSFAPRAPIEVYARAGIRHKYSFAKNAAKQKVLTESNRIPLEYVLSAGSGARVNAIRITRYGLNIASVQFSSLWGCIHVCQAVADSRGLIMADNQTKLAYVKLVDTVTCNKIEGLYTYSSTENDTITSTDACTTPPKDLRNLASIVQELANLLSSNAPYRTLKVNVTSSARYWDSKTVEIAPNRGLIMETETGVSGTPAAKIPGVRFILNRLSELTLDGLTLSGVTQVEVPELATFEIAGCTIQKELSSGDVILLNEGKTSVVNSKVKKDSRLLNRAGGRLQLTYVEFSDNSAIVTDSSNETDLVVSRLQLYDTFDLPSHITLPDARRYYTVVDEDEWLCSGRDDGTPVVSTYDLNAYACENRCEELDLCSGFMSYTVNDADDEPQCDVCVKDNDACSLNCSKSVVSLYKNAESHFDYAKVIACPFLERNLRAFPGVSLEQCKMLCSYYKSCDGFEYSTRNASTRSLCGLVADLDFASEFSCSSKSRPFYIPFVVEYAEGFVNVSGTLLESAAMASHPGLGTDKCAAVCKKTIGCSSFISIEQGAAPLCTLHGDNRFIVDGNTNKTGLHVGVSDIFPKNRYMNVRGCISQATPSSSAIEKTEERCQVACGQNLSCAALVFRPFTLHNESNCFLFSRNDLIDSLFDPDVTCAGREANVTVAYFTDSFDVASGRRFVPYLNLSGDILLDECKSLCLQEVGCVALSHSAATFNCVLGYLVDGESSTTYLALTARTVDSQSRYLSNVVCYSGEELQSVVPDFVEETQGFARWPRTCSGNATVVGSPSMVLSPVECGLLCTAGCVGFNYFVNYGGSRNLNKIGRCELLGGDVVFDDCDAIDLNEDTYLRPKDFSTCEAMCNVHQLCSSFIVDSEVGCRLFSDIALTSCEGGVAPRLVHTSLSYLERDAMVKVPNQCFVRFEDTATIGCYAASIESLIDQGAAILLDLPNSIAASMTPFLCQQHCSKNRSSYYAVAEGDKCLCSSDFEFYSKLESSTNCTATCLGDAGQQCGGKEAVQVGSTNLPIEGITLSECKKKCFESSSCRGLVYSDSVSKSCDMRASALFDECPPHETAAAYNYIESIEHYYAAPKTSYSGGSVVFRSTTTTASECQVLCDYYSSCYSVRFNAALSVQNCELLGGSKVAINSTAEGVMAALDVNLFTMGWSPDIDAKIVTFSNVFDQDECRSLCEEHARCGAFLFKAKSCTLYKANGFAVASETLPAASPYFVSYHTFVDPDQEFVKAKELCVDDTATVLESRVTTQSEYDCASRCNRNALCALFTYNTLESKNCVLYSGGARLSKSTNGQGCLNGGTVFAMYTTAMFSLQNGTCLKDEGSGDFVFFNKQLVECSALCDEWFNCRSFRYEEASGDCRLFKSEQYSSSACKGIEQPGDLYVYYSDSNYAELGGDFCVSASSFISQIESAPLEACKVLCDLLDSCVAFSHSQNGLCTPYSSNDFSVPCTPSTDRSLFISTRNVVDSSKPKYTFKAMDTCFNVTAKATANVTADAALVNSESDCEDKCSQNLACFAYQYSPQSRRCDVLNGTLPVPVTCASVQHATAYLRTETYPYKTERDTCLRNPIRFTSSNGTEARILNVEEYECIALCEAHYSCRYVLYGSSSSGTHPALRECILFEAQVKVLTECKDYTGVYNKRTALVNGRTFLDINTRFGEPETTFAKVSGITYQECASLCDQLGSQCQAFIHTWNYRRSSTASSPEMFSKSRIIHSRFAPGINEKARFLQLDLVNKQFVVAEAFSDDDVKAQTILFEQVRDDGTTPSYAFRTRSGYCVSGSSFSLFPDGDTLDIIRKNFGNESSPVCQELDVSPCNSTEVILFTFDDQRGFQALNASFSSKGNSFTGCLSVVPMASSADDKDFLLTGDVFGDLKIPVIESQNTTTSSMNCTSRQSRVLVKYAGDSIVTEFNWTSDNDCSEIRISASTCNYSDTVILSSNTVSNTTTCQYIPTEICSSAVNQSLVVVGNATTIMGISVTANSSYIIQNRSCYYASTINQTVRTFSQKTAVNLLNEMHDFFKSTCPQTGNSSSARVFSRSYAKGCRFDEKVASFPYQLFDYASDEVQMLHEISRLCLSNDLSLSDCAGDDPTAWTYMFTSGFLFYIEPATRDMKCLSRLPGSEQLSVVACDSSAIDAQSWVYVPRNGTISNPGNNSDCLVSTNGTAQLGSCSDTSARWSQYSECRLNTHSHTRGMRLESFDNEGMCISTEGTDLKACEGSDVGEWRYYYNSANFSKGRLERLVPVESPPQCLGRVPGDIEIPEKYLPETSPNGILPCDATLINDPLVVFYRTTLYGEDRNVLSFLVNNSGDYCVRIPNGNPLQVKCGSGNEQQWRAYGTAGDATELSLKPGAASQEIKDFEVALQFFLFSSEGKASRILRANTAKLRRLVDTILPLIEETASSVSTVSDLIQSVEDPASELSTRLNKLERIFKAFGIVLKPVESVPYVGPTVKGLGLSQTCSQLSKRTKDGSKAIDDAALILNSTYAPIDAYAVALDSLASNMEIGMSVIEVVVDYTTRMHFCAYKDGLLDEYKRMLSWINTLSSSVNTAISFVSSLSNYFGAMDTLQFNLNFGIFQKFREFKKLVDGLDGVAEFFSFLNFIADFRLCIPRVYVGTCPVDLGLFKFSINCIKLQSEFCVGIEWVGDLLQSIENIIRGIPLVGNIWDWILEQTKSLIRAFFRWLAAELPDFSLQLSFVDGMKDSINKAKAFFRETKNLIKNAVLIEGDLYKRVQEGVDKLLNRTFPKKWLDLLDCQNSSCFSHVLNVDIIDDVIPGVSIDGVNYTVDSDLVDAVQNMVADLGDVYEEVSKLLEGNIECREYKTFEVDYAEVIARTFGKTAAELGVPNCPSTWQLCVDIEMSNLEGFQTVMTQKLEDWGLIGPGGRQLQGECTLPGGVSIPLKLPKKTSEFLFKVVRDKSRNILSEKQKSQLKQAEAEAKNFVETVQGRVVPWLSEHWDEIRGLGKLPALEKQLKKVDLRQLEFSMSKEAMAAAASAKIVLGCKDGTVVAQLEVLPFLKVGFDVNFLGWFRTSLGKKHLKSSAASTLTAQSRALLKANEYACALDAIEGTMHVAKSSTYKPRWNRIETKVSEFLATLDSTGVSSQINERLKTGRKLWLLKLARALETMAENSADPQLANHEEFESAHESAMELRASMHQIWSDVHPKFRDEVTKAYQLRSPTVKFEADDCAGPKEVPKNNPGMDKAALKSYVKNFLDDFTWNPIDVEEVSGVGSVLPEISLARTSIDAKGSKEETSLSIQYKLFNHLRCLVVNSSTDFDPKEVSYDVVQWFKFFFGIGESFKPNSALEADGADSLMQAAFSSKTATESAQLSQKLTFATEWSFGFLTIDFRELDKSEEVVCSKGDCCKGAFCIGLGLSLDELDFSCDNSEEED